MGMGGKHGYKDLEGTAHLPNPLRSAYAVCDMFSLPALAWVSTAQVGSSFVRVQWGAVSSLTPDDLVRCERAFSNLEGNKLSDFFFSFW